MTPTRFQTQHPLLLLLCILCMAHVARAQGQWEYLGSPEGGDLRTLFATSDGRAVFATDGRARQEGCESVISNGNGVDAY